MFRLAVDSCGRRGCFQSLSICDKLSLISTNIKNQGLILFPWMRNSVLPKITNARTLSGLAEVEGTVAETGVSLNCPLR